MAAAEPNAEPTPELATAQSPAKLTVACKCSPARLPPVWLHSTRVKRFHKSKALWLNSPCAAPPRWAGAIWPVCSAITSVWSTIRVETGTVPSAQGAKRSNWLDASHKLILAGVDHYQVVFTLLVWPSIRVKRHRAIVTNCTNCYSVPRGCRLKETIETEQGFDPARLMVLHTWNQQLEAHALTYMP